MKRFLVLCLALFTFHLSPFTVHAAKTTFVEGNKSTGTHGTTVSAAYLNAVNNHRHDGADADGSGVLDYAAAGGSANAITVALTPALTAHVAGMPIAFKAAAANTGATTVQVNSLAAKPIKRPDGSALTANDITAGQIVVVAYDGTNYQMISPRTPAVVTDAQSLNGKTIVYGRIDGAASSSGSGAGYTWARTALGRYTITFNPPFTSIPVTTFTLLDITWAGIMESTDIPATTSTVSVGIFSAIYVNKAFSFVAIGTK